MSISLLSMHYHSSTCARTRTHPFLKPHCCCCLTFYRFGLPYICAHAILMVYVLHTHCWLYRTHSGRYELCIYHRLLYGSSGRFSPHSSHGSTWLDLWSLPVLLLDGSIDFCNTHLSPHTHAHAPHALPPWHALPPLPLPALCAARTAATRLHCPPCTTHTRAHLRALRCYPTVVYYMLHAHHRYTAHAHTPHTTRTCTSYVCDFTFPRRIYTHCIYRVPLLRTPGFGSQFPHGHYLVPHYTC